MTKPIRISLKAARTNAGLTIADAAQQLGVSRYTLMSYEAGKTRPKVDTAQQMARLYGMPLKHFLFAVKPIKMDDESNEDGLKEVSQ